MMCGRKAPRQYSRGAPRANQPPGEVRRVGAMAALDLRQSARRAHNRRRGAGSSPHKYRLNPWFFEALRHPAPRAINQAVRSGDAGHTVTLGVLFRDV